MLRSWFNVIKFYGHLKAQARVLQSSTEDIRGRLALQRWRDRKNATLRLRNKGTALARKLGIRSLGRLFHGWSEVIQTEKEFVATLSRLARKLDHSALKQAFDDVNNFAAAKAVSH